VSVTHLNVADHPIDDVSYRQTCRLQLEADGALVLRQFFTADAIEQVVRESAPFESEAFYAGSTHNVYLTDADPDLPPGHAFNRQIASSKGLIADDQIGAVSPLRSVYDDSTFRSFIADLVGVTTIYPYADALSSINVHYAAEGMELGWHFDNSSFAITMLLQAPEGGGTFEYVPAVRNAATGDNAYDRVINILDRHEAPMTLSFDPGDLVLFRGRDAIHRVTPTQGDATRMLVVFAFNDEPNVRLSDSALTTFYGRTY